MKNEFCGNIMVKCVEIRAKSYSYLIVNARY